ncbi:MAG: response regulator, partial [Butyrivibrio sp.]|nr:response regulator [Butyrivibrio sp.]
MDIANTKIIDSIFSSYILIYQIDLANDFIKVVYETEEFGSFDMDKQGVYSEFNTKYSKTRIDEEFSAERERLGSIENLRKELSVKDVYEISYTVNYGKWRTVEFRILERNKKKIPTLILMCFRRLEDDRAEAFKIKKENEKNRELLEIALSEARQASKAKTDFLSNMSHDIRTPMNAIIGYATLAKANINNPEKAYGYIDKTLTASKTLMELIGNILDITKIESGRFQLEQEPNNINAVIEDLLSEVKPLADKKKHTINYNVRVKNPVVLADKGKLIRILQNILLNSINYTNDNGIIDIKVLEYESQTKGYSSYQFEISDNGFGISDDFKDKIYEPFSRENDQRVAFVNGSGLGLSIVKQMMELLGGTITFSSEKEKGTKFILRIDLKQPGQEVLNKINALNGGRHAENGSIAVSDAINNGILRGKRFLVVDDNQINVDILVDIIKSLGAAAESASNGLMALEMIRRNNSLYYNAVLMDIKMPIMDGRKAVKEIRKLSDSFKSGIPVIGISANAFADEKRKALQAGCDAFLSKPINTNELIYILKEVS